MRYIVSEYLGVDGRPSVTEIHGLDEPHFEDQAVAYRGFRRVRHGPFESLDICRLRCHQLGYKLRAVDTTWAIERWMASYFVDDDSRLRPVH